MASLSVAEDGAGRVCAPARDGAGFVSDVDELSEEIERLRRRLIETVQAERGFLCPEVLHLSLRLDQLMVAYLRDTHSSEQAAAAD